jgi:MFS transporter, FSR family, fosmidomycin resistance protein
MTRASPVLAPSSALAQAFSNVGHSYSHILTILYPTVVLALEHDWGMSYGELIALMLAGQILFGVAALPAGWLGDRWSAVGMMVVFFIGTGAAAVLTGLARNPYEIALGLALIGTFASIYHPVGMAWLVRTAVNRGKALGVNGIFGSVGLAIGPMLAGALTDFVSWRAAFIVPGATAVAVGLALVAAWAVGSVKDTKLDLKPQPEPARGDVVRAFFILSVTMLCTGLIGAAYMIMLPKVFAERMGDVTGGSALGAGALVTIVYLFGATSQYVGGRLSDRFSMKRVYLVGFIIQAPLLLATVAIGGWPLLGLTIATVFANYATIPAENGLLAHFSPGKWRGTAYGAKFVLALGVAALAIPVVAYIYDTLGGFNALYALMGALAAVVAVSAVFLPDDRAGREVLPAAAAEAAE